jgi:hypothetical protein
VKITKGPIIREFKVVFQKHLQQLSLKASINQSLSAKSAGNKNQHRLEENDIPRSVYLLLVPFYSPRYRMEFVKTYFNEEKSASLLFLCAGVLAVLAGLYFWLWLKKPLYTGMAYPLVLIGLIELAVGATVNLRTATDIERVQNQLSLEPEKIQSEEIPRMVKVMRSFVYIRYAELFLILTGIMFMYYITRSAFVKGIGAGLFIQACLMLTADYFAERRGEQYLQELQKQTEVYQKKS